MKTAAIIGAGHNGLTCAAYLSKAGFAVSVFEKSGDLGGLCITERPFKKAPKIKVSSVASYYGMLRQEVVKELALEEHGLKPYLTDPIEIVLLDNGQFVFTPRDGGEAKTRVNGLTTEQTDGWQKFWADIQKAAALIYPHYLKPGLTQSGVVTMLKESGLDHVAKNVFDGSLFELLAHYVENDNLKAVASTCTPGFASDRGSVFGCIHHGTASTCGEFGAWGQVFGGMGEITTALTDVALQNDARIHLDTPVKSLVVNAGLVEALEFEDGTRESFDLVISAIDPYVLFEKLLPQTAESCREIREELHANRPKVSAAKLHFLLKDLPSFKTLTEIGHNHKGVIVIAPSKEAVERAAKVVPEGQMPDALMLTMAFPTLEDPSMRSGMDGQAETETDNKRHVLTVDIHYLPARIGGKAWSAADDNNLLEATIKAIETQCPEIRQYIEESFIVSPRALAERYGVASLSCWHLPMTPPHLFEKRSLKGCEHYKTPLTNLYVCSAGTYPGGNVTAAPGHNLAKMLIADFHQESTQLQAQTSNR